MRTRSADEQQQTQRRRDHRRWHGAEPAFPDSNARAQQLDPFMQYQFFDGLSQPFGVLLGHNDRASESLRSFPPPNLDYDDSLLLPLSPPSVGDWRQS
jgi:hypothetical protein